MTWSSIQWQMSVLHTRQTFGNSEQHFQVQQHQRNWPNGSIKLSWRWGQYSHMDPHIPGWGDDMYSIASMNGKDSLQVEAL